MLRIEGPSHATRRDFDLHAGPARALLVENCDQRGGRILADQLNANGPANGITNAAALRLCGLDHSDVLLRSLQGSGNGGRWVEVLGRPAGSRAIPIVQSSVTVRPSTSNLQLSPSMLARTVLGG